MNPEIGQPREAQETTAESVEKKIAKGAVSIAALAATIEILMM